LLTSVTKNDFIQYNRWKKKEIATAY